MIFNCQSQLISYETLHQSSVNSYLQLVSYLLSSSYACLLPQFPLVAVFCLCLGIDLSVFRSQLFYPMLSGFPTSCCSYPAPCLHMCSTGPIQHFRATVCLSEILLFSSLYYWTEYMFCYLMLSPFTCGRVTKHPWFVYPLSLLGFFHSFLFFTEGPMFPLS